MNAKEDDVILLSRSSLIGFIKDETGIDVNIYATTFNPTVQTTRVQYLEKKAVFNIYITKLKVVMIYKRSNYLEIHHSVLQLHYLHRQSSDHKSHCKLATTIRTIDHQEDS